MQPKKAQQPERPGGAGLFPCEQSSSGSYEINPSKALGAGGLQVLVTEGREAVAMTPWALP